MRYCFADKSHDDLDFWVNTDSEFHSILLRAGYCIGWSTSDVYTLLDWAKDAFFVLRAKKYTSDGFINICIAAAKGDYVETIFGGDIIKLPYKTYWGL